MVLLVFKETNMDKTENKMSVMRISVNFTAKFYN